jgi:hypothetical protein
MQDIDIPKHFACVAAPTSQETQVGQYITIPGVLWQHHEGFRLVDVAAHAPRESWQFICEDAIRIVNIFTERGILNLNVRTRSCIVQGNKGNEFKSVMIDFALCNFPRNLKMKKGQLDVTCKESYRVDLIITKMLIVRNWMRISRWKIE